MKRFTLAILLCGCATDRLPDGARFQSNTQERFYSNGPITYHTLGEDHVGPTKAGGEAAGRIIHQSFAGLTSVGGLFIPGGAMAPATVVALKGATAIAIPSLTKPVISATPTPTSVPVIARLKTH